MTHSTSRHELTPDSSHLEVEKISSTYNKTKYIYDAIVNEATFIINDSTINEGIKIHGIESRVKELSSLLKKCAEKGAKDPFSEICDIAGIRVICLFRSDLGRMDNIIRNSFKVISVDDKRVSRDNDAV